MYRVSWPLGAEEDLESVRALGGTAHAGRRPWLPALAGRGVGDFAGRLYGI